MNIVIIGTGNTATVLGKKLKAAGHHILQVFGRDNFAASELAYELETESTNYWNVVNPTADMYLLAVSDVAVEEVFRELHLADKLVVHTAASVPLHALKGKSKRYGVLYPLQTLKKEVSKLPETPILIDASDEKTLDLLQVLARSVSDRVFVAGDEKRLKMHLAAVMVNNFPNHLYALVENYCVKEGLDFGMLLPMIRETAMRLETVSPALTQTGPAVRNDTPTISKHRGLLDAYPQLKKVYELFTESIVQSR